MSPKSFNFSQPLGFLEVCAQNYHYVVDLFYGHLSRAVDIGVNLCPGPAGGYAPSRVGFESRGGTTSSFIHIEQCAPEPGSWQLSAETRTDLF